VSHKTHLRSVQVGNACVKEGNTHVNDEGYNTSVRSEPCKLRSSRNILQFYLSHQYYNKRVEVLQSYILLFTFFVRVAH